MTPTSRTILFGTLLAFTAGAVDTLGFVALFGLFTAHVTGNLVLLGAALVNDTGGGVVSKLLALPVFILVVVLARLFLLSCRRRKRPATRPLLGTQILLLAGFMVAGALLAPFAEDAALTVAVGMLGVAAMTLQNVAARTVFSNHVPTTVMTGNVTQTVIDLVDLAQGEASEEVRARLRKFLPAVLVFAVGGLVGALGYVVAGYWALLAPLAAILAVFVMLPKEG